MGGPLGEEGGGVLMRREPAGHLIMPCSTSLRCRVAQHGRRQFRWPDGSLQDTAPPPNPYAVVRFGSVELHVSVG